MKILVIHIYYYPDVIGGAEYSLKKFCEGMANNGHQVAVLCDTRETNKDEIINDIKVYRRKLKCIIHSKSKIKKYFVLY